MAGNPGPNNNARGQGSQQTENFVNSINNNNNRPTEAFQDITQQQPIIKQNPYGAPPFGQIFNQPIVQSLVKQPEKSQSNVVENTGFPSNPIQEQPYSSYTQNVEQQYQPSQIAKVVEEGSGGAFNSPQLSDNQGIVFPDSYQEEELPIFSQPQPSPSIQ